MLTKKVGFELGAWSKHYLALISRREYEAAQQKKMAGGCDVDWTCGDYNPLNFGRIEMIGGYYLKVDFIL